MIATPKIETKRLVLDPMTIEHTTAVIQVRTDPETLKWSIYGPVKTEPEAKTFLSKFFVNDSPDQPRRFGWAVYLPSDLDHCIGHVSIMGQKPEDNSSETLPVYHVGYMFLPSAWNKGYATEAMSAVIDTMAAKLKPAKLMAWIDIDNKGSIRVAEKLGFVFAERRVFSQTPRFLAGEMREDAVQIYRRDIQ